MATTTPNFGWPVPTSTDLVKDGATAIEALGDAIDASLIDLEGGTTGQILAKNSNTDMDFVWITNDVGDITAVTAGTGISGGGTSGAVTVTNSMATTMTTKGDLVPATGSGTFARLAVSATNDMVLMSDSAASTGLAWSATWTNFTPTWTATTTNPVIGNGTLAGKYIKIGKTVIAQYHLVAGSTTTFGSGNYRFSLPINADRIAALQGGVPGSAFIEDNGVANYQAVAVRLPFADRVEFLTTSTLPVSNTSPFTWANGDFMMAEVVYGVA